MAKDKIVKIASVKEQRANVQRSKSGTVVIPGLRTESFKTLVIGTAPLMCHNFSVKGQGAILAKHMGEASAGRERKDPQANFEAARYRLSDGGDGVPAGGIKACIVKGFIKGSGVFASRAKGAIRVIADDDVTNLVRIIGPQDKSEWPCIENNGRGGVVRNASGVVDIRHRPVYWPWGMQLQIEFYPAIASMVQVLQAIATAGFIEGLCEWRPGSKESLSGTLGAFRLATTEEIEAWEDGRLFEKWPHRSRRKSGASPDAMARQGTAGPG